MDPAFEELLGNADWVRRIARGLVGDAATADDLAQDAWVAALGAGESGVRSPRAFLRGIVRNLARERRRSARRRHERERRAAKAEALPSAAELAEELAARRSVADALLRLAEPYRTTLFLRYFRDLSLARIAALEGGLPVSTVHARVQRGLALLRTALASEGRSDERLLPALVFLARPRPGLLATVTGGLAVSTSLKLSLLALALCGGGLALWSSRAATARREAVALEKRPPRSLPLAEAPRPELPSPSAELRAPKEGVEAAAPAPSSALPTEAPRPRAIEGEVVDPSGTPLASIELGLGAEAGATTTARSDASGRFTLLPPKDTERALVRVRDAEYTTLVFGFVDLAAPGDGPAVVVVAARRRALAGTVRTTDGAPLADVTVAVRRRQDLYRRLAIERAPDWLPEPTAWMSTTDVEGRFSLPDVPLAEGTYVSAEKLGFEPGFLDLPDRSDDDVAITLRAEEQPIVFGTVTDAGGVALPGARVSFGHEIATADEHGGFRIPLEEPDAPGRLTALAPGHLPAELAFDAGGLRSPVLLVLGGPPLAIEGRVVDEDGTPRGGVDVSVTDPRPFGSERMSQGREAAAFTLTIEDLLAGGYGESATTTDAEGAFRLRGLLPRTYTLGLFDRATLAAAPAGAVDGGARGVVLTLAADPGARPIAGRVVSSGGVGLAGVTVRPTRGVSGPSGTWLGGTGADVTTDADGAFAFDALVTEGTVFDLLDDDTFPRLRIALAGRDPGALELVLPLACSFRVELADGVRADTLRVLDQDLKALRLTESYGIYVTFREEAELSEGRSSVLECDERARTLVLEREGVEVARLPLALVPGETTVVRP